MSNLPTLKQAKHTLILLDQQQLNAEQMDALHFFLPHLAEGVKGEVIPELDEFRAMFGLPPREMITEIDFGKPLSEIIAAAGNDWVNPNITADNFPVVGSGVRRFRNKMFPGGVSSEDGIEAMKKENFMPSTHVHGFAFSAKFPGEQRKYPYNCLGSSAEVDRDRHVVCFDGDGAERGADLDGWANHWPADWRLLGVQEISGA